MLRIFTVLALALLLSGCLAKVTDVFKYVESQSASKVAAAVDVYCNKLGGQTEKRKSFVTAVNAKTTKGDILGFDCNSDGKPDF